MGGASRPTHSAMTRVKICGITNLEDAKTAVEAGADALGFIFVENTPRFVTPAQVAPIVRALPPFVTTVGLFVLRSRRPDLPRPVKAPMYPFLPGLYLVATAVFCVNLLFQKPLYTWPGLIIVATGIPVYFIWRKVGGGSMDNTAA